MTEQIILLRSLKLNYGALEALQIALNSVLKHFGENRRWVLMQCHLGAFYAAHE